jgi:hypothetical protein
MLLSGERDLSKFELRSVLLGELLTSREERSRLLFGAIVRERPVSVPLRSPLTLLRSLMLLLLLLLSKRPRLLSREPVALVLRRLSANLLRPSLRSRPE